MAAGILHETQNVHRWLLAHSKSFPHGEAEVQMIINRLDNNSPSLTTTSCGRILDAVSAILHICHERTYQGEPAIKLESAATVGHDVLRLKPEIKDGILNTTSAVSAIFKAKDTYSAADLAYSIQSYLARGMAQLAIEAAQKANINAIGFSGGVAYNKHITLTMRKYVETRGLTFYVHGALPAGDGGISFGQAFATAIAPE
jgi:hydrogenase maturation protein HypF